MKRTSLLILIFFAWFHYAKAQVAVEDKHWLIVTTDLGGSDPDGDDLVFKWSVYTDPGSYKGEVKIDDSDKAKYSVHVPMDAKGKNMHVILELTDKGTPALTVYRRMVLDVN